MFELYTSTRSFDARRVYEIWLEIVQNEQLYDAIMRDDFEVGRKLGYSDEDVAILQDFARQPGTRWHVENLRYRATMMVSRFVDTYLPATMQLLTGGSADWQRDLVFEYLALHRWIEFGHYRRFAECARFVAFVRTRVMLRRRPPPHIEDVMALEVGTLDLLARGSTLAADAWQPTGASDLVCAGPVQAVVELGADIVDWMRAPRGEITLGPLGPRAVLLVLPSPSSDVVVEPLDDGARALLAACQAPVSLATLAATGPAHADVLARWRERRIIVPAASRGK